VRLPVGISDFQELITGKYIFADKSLLIKDIMEDGAKVLLITRPRRFGKTLNLSMSYHFLQMNFPSGEDLFRELAIAEDKEFCNKHHHQYPVIFISFKGVKQSNYISAYNFITDLIRRLYVEHRYLLDSDLLLESEKKIFTNILDKEADEADIIGSIRQLSEYMVRKFGKPAIILIDEYDTPIQEAYLEDYYSEMIKLMRGILGEALKDNSCLAKAVITGITRISQESMFSGLNNIKVYSLLNEKYGQYFGFIEAEVSNLIAETGQPVELSAIKEWYNGYQVGKYVLYNPWSIINCLSNEGALQPYWLNTSSNDLIYKLLSNASVDVKYAYEELLQGKEIERSVSDNLVFSDIEQRTEYLWSLLLHAGYLKVLSRNLVGNKFMCTIAIPNKEVSFVYDHIIEHWFETKRYVDAYNKFTLSLINGDIEKFKMYLSSYILQTSSYFDFNKNSPEQVFHVFILGLVVGLREHYYINSNQEAGMGRVDVIFIPHDKQKKGILLEFKVSEREDLLLERAQEALKQIKDKQYFEAFKQQKVSDVLAIGLAFCGKQVELAYENLSLSKLQ
jgi:hypothetical protein